MKISELDIYPNFVATLALKNVYNVNDFLASDFVDLDITAEEYIQICQQIPHKFDFSKFPIFLRLDSEDIDANGIYYLYNYDASNYGRNYARVEVEAALMTSILHTLEISLKPSLKSDCPVGADSSKFQSEPPAGRVRGKIDSDLLNAALSTIYQADVDYLHDLGINSIAHMADGFYIWGQQFIYEGTRGFIVEQNSFGLNPAFFQMLLECDAIIYTHEKAVSEYATIKFENAKAAFAHAYENMRGVVIEQFTNNTLPDGYKPMWPEGLTTDVLVSEIMTSIYNDL